jgi:hypothetical protein
MEIKVDGAMLHDVVSAAILRSLDERQREDMIKAAIASLLTPKDSYGGSRRATPLQDAFFSAMRTVAERICTETLANDAAVAVRIKALIAEALERVLVDKRENMIDKLAVAIAAGLAYDRG